MAATSAPSAAPAGVDRRSPRTLPPRDGAPPPAPPVAMVALALAAVYLIWGSTYLGIRVAIDDIPVLVLPAVRFLVAGALLYAVARRRAPRPTPRQWASTAVVGILLLGIANGGVGVAEQYVSTGLVALLVASVPLWMALFARLLLGDRLDPLAAVSLGVGFLGVALLVSPGGGGNPLGLLAVLVSPLAWSLGSIYARRAPLPADPLLGAGMEMLAAGAAALLAAAVSGQLFHVHGDALGWRPLLAVAYLVSFGSLVGYTAYAWLLQRVPVSLVSTYAYVNPFVAVLLGVVFLGETVTPRLLIGGAVVAVAVALIITRRRPAASRRDVAADTGPAVLGAPAQSPGVSCAGSAAVAPAASGEGEDGRGRGGDGER